MCSLSDIMHCFFKGHSLISSAMLALQKVRFGALQKVRFGAIIRDGSVTSLILQMGKATSRGHKLSEEHIALSCQAGTKTSVFQSSPHRIPSGL